MKTIISLSIFLISIGSLFQQCSTKNAAEIPSKQINITDSLFTCWINYYKVPVYGADQIELGYLYQTGDTVNEENWTPLFEPLIGLSSYKWGYIYKIKVKKEVTKNPMQDAGNVTYQVKTILEKKAIPEGTSFQVRIPLQLISAQQDYYLLAQEQSFILEEKINRTQFNRILSKEEDANYLMTFKIIKEGLILTQLEKT